MKTNGAITTPDIPWIYMPPPNKSSKCLLLTVGGVATVGAWLDGEGLRAWCPLPKRDRRQEAIIDAQTK